MQETAHHFCISYFEGEFLADYNSLESILLKNSGMYGYYSLEVSLNNGMSLFSKPSIFNESI